MNFFRYNLLPQFFAFHFGTFPRFQSQDILFTAEMIAINMQHGVYSYNSGITRNSKGPLRFPIDKNICFKFFIVISWQELQIKN
jgi:hypothetical protein